MHRGRHGFDPRRRLSMKIVFARDHAAEARVHPEMARAGWPDDVPKPQVYNGMIAGKPTLWALVGRERKGGRPDTPLRWHISIQGPGRVPTWEELVQACHELRPGVPFVISIPPRSLWMNVHPNVLHCWQTDDPLLVEEWRANRIRGHVPT